MNVIISGASRGIGFAVAEAFAKEGHRLLLNSRSEEKLSRAVETLQGRHPQCQVDAKACDLSQRDSAIAFGNWCLQFGKPDVLVNNAGVFEPGNVSDEAEGVLESQVATNLYSAYHLTRTMLPAMVQNKSGHIFNICSVASLQAYPGGGAYSISKFALYGFNQNLRHELKPHGIKVTAVMPGAVLTDSWGGFDNSDHRIMEADDIAQLIYNATQLSPGACVEEIVVRPLRGDL